MKKKVLNFYYQNGVKVGKFLLISTAFASILAFTLIVLGKFNLFDSLVMVLAIPALSLVVTLTRLLLAGIYRVFNIRSFFLKTIFAVFAFVFCGVGISPIFQAMDGLSELVFSIIIVGFDVIYFAVMVLLLTTDRFKNKANIVDIEEIELSK